jgi:hypothetical protein
MTRGGHRLRIQSFDQSRRSGPHRMDHGNEAIGVIIQNLNRRTFAE